MNPGGLVVSGVRVTMVGAEQSRPAVRRPGDLRRRLDELAERVQRLAPHSRDPHRFHEQKSEIVAELRSLAREHADGLPL